ncbi:unnamed protein product, partial [Coregonus sp. 'balchen']
MAMLTIFLLLSAAFALGDARDLNDAENLIPNLPIESEEMGAKEKWGLQTRSSSCPPGWHSSGTHCYQYVPILANWPEAEHYCLLLGGNLASVHSRSQYNFLLSNWGQGQPDNSNHGAWNDNTNGREHCMEMNYGGDRGQNDAPCRMQLPFMCSRKL